MLKFNFINNIADSWLAAIRSFSPKGLIETIYMSFRSIYYLLSTLLASKKEVIFILILSLVAIISNITLFAVGGKNITLSIALLFSALLAILSYYLLLNIRPSVETKDQDYFVSYSFRGVLYFLLTVLFLFFLYNYFFAVTSKIYFLDLIKRFINKIFAIIFMIPSHIESLNNLFEIFLSPFIIIPFLFLNDSRPNLFQFLRAIYRGFKMIVYNYPFFLILFYLTKLIMTLIASLVGLAFPQSFSLIRADLYFDIIILLPIYYSFLVNFYIKRLHEQFDIYY